MNFEYSIKKTPAKRCYFAELKQGKKINTVRAVSLPIDITVENETIRIGEGFSSVVDEESDVVNFDVGNVWDYNKYTNIIVRWRDSSNEEYVKLTKEGRVVDYTHCTHDGYISVIGIPNGYFAPPAMVATRFKRIYNADSTVLKDEDGELCLTIRHRAGDVRFTIDTTPHIPGNSNDAVIGFYLLGNLFITPIITHKVEENS